MSASKIDVTNVPTREAYQQALEAATNGETRSIAQEIVDRFALYLKYPQMYRGYFLYQLRVSQENILPKVRELLQEYLSPLGWHVSYTWESATLSYNFTIK